MNPQKLGTALAVAGAAYLVTVAWLSSWWYVPAAERFGFRALAEAAHYGGAAFSIVWATSGVLGAFAVALGVALHSAVGKFRLLCFAAGSAALTAWIVLWSSSSHHGAVFGIGGGLILLCFLTSCLDWAAMRRHVDGRAKTASDLRLAAHVSFFIAAWGLCGLLGAPIFALRPELAEAYQTASAGRNLAVKVLVGLVLGWAFTAAAQRMERRGRRHAG
jgi:hypothetical protein